MDDAEKIARIATDPTDPHWDSLVAAIRSYAEGRVKEARATTHCKVRCGCFAYQRARAEALEEAAKVAQDASLNWKDSDELRAKIAEAIRALKGKP